MIEAYCQALVAALSQSVPSWQSVVAQLCRERLVERPHGDMPSWLRALATLPDVPASGDTAADVVTLQASHGPVPARSEVEPALRALMPWRKGPFRIFDVDIDTEWRSDWKWRRIFPHLADLTGRRVLDVGCGSGYHCWRMWGAGAREVVGIDPTLLYLFQFLVFRRYLPDAPVWFAPLRLEELPLHCQAFDTVFSMGVLYHRRSPLDHLLELHAALRSGGELVLETLVVEGDEHTVLVPEDRYAAMRNVYFLPSVSLLGRWLARSGFVDIRCVDINQTSPEEQRRTEWMTFQSLSDFLNPVDPTLTQEGYPAPRRATLLARRP